MKRQLFVVVILFMSLSLMVFHNSKEEMNLKKELSNILNLIEENLYKNGSQVIVSQYFIDEKNSNIVVGLVENSEENQEWFRKNVVDSDYIKFVYGGEESWYFID